MVALRLVILGIFLHSGCSTALVAGGQKPRVLRLNKRSSKIGKNVTFVTLAYGEPFTTVMKDMVQSLRRYTGVEQVIAWDDTSFESAFAKERVAGREVGPLRSPARATSAVSEVRVNKLGNNYDITGREYARQLVAWRNKFRSHTDKYSYMWKPWIINRALEGMNWGDPLIYSDSTRHGPQGSRARSWAFNASLLPLVELLEGTDGAGGMCLPFSLEEEWRRWGSEATVRQSVDLHLLLNETVCAGRRASKHETCAQRAAKDVLMRQGSWLVLYKTERTMRFVQKWLSYCQSEHILLQVPHQDQDAMALAALETGMPCAWLPSEGGFPSYESGWQVKHLNNVLPHLKRVRLRQAALGRP